MTNRQAGRGAALDSFEMCTAASPSLSTTSVHQIGAVAVLKLRCYPAAPTAFSAVDCQLHCRLLLEGLMLNVDTIQASRLL